MGWSSRQCQSSKCRSFSFSILKNCSPQSWEKDSDSSTSWWLNQPFWNICSSNWIISPNRDEHTKCLKPPSSYNFDTKFILILHQFMQPVKQETSLQNQSIFAHVSPNRVKRHAKTVETTWTTPWFIRKNLSKCSTVGHMTFRKLTCPQKGTIDYFKKRGDLGWGRYKLPRLIFRKQTLSFPNSSTTLGGRKLVNHVSARAHGACWNLLIFETNRYKCFIRMGKHIKYQVIISLWIIHDIIIIYIHIYIYRSESRWRSPLPKGWRKSKFSGAMIFTKTNGRGVGVAPSMKLSRWTKFKTYKLLVGLLGGWAPRTCKWWTDGPPIYVRHELNGHLEGVQSNPILRGRNQSPWLLTTYPKWDDPPSTVYPMMNRSGERETDTSHSRLSRFLRSSFSRALCIKRKPSEAQRKTSTCFNAWLDH